MLNIYQFTCRTQVLMDFIKCSLLHSTLLLSGLQHEKCQSLSCARLFATPPMTACQAPLSMGFSRQGYQSGLPFPSPEDFPYPGIKPRSPALQADALPSEPPQSQKILAINMVEGVEFICTTFTKEDLIFRTSSCTTFKDVVLHLRKDNFPLCSQTMG